MGTKAKKPPYVEVEWIDARGWAVETLAFEDIPLRVNLRERKSVGWLMYQDSEKTILATDYDPPEGEDGKEEWGDFNCVPTGWITKVRRLKGAGVQKDATEATAVRTGGSESRAVGGEAKES